MYGRNGVALVSGRDGAPLWQHWLAEGTSEQLVLAKALVDLNKDGVGDVVLLHMIRTQPNYSQSDVCKLTALSGRDGAVLWERESQWEQQINTERMSPPVVVDLDGQGHFDVLFLERYVQPPKPGVSVGGVFVALKAFDAQTGKPRWTFEPEAGQTKSEYSIASGTFCVADIQGNGGRVVCLAVYGGKAETILLDAQGQVIQRRDNYARWSAAGDLVGDGRDELLWPANNKLRAMREVWSN